MKTPSRSTVGASSIAARRRSLSRKRVRPDGGAAVVRARGSATTSTAPPAPPAPPAIGCFTGSPVNFLELARGPLHRIFGLHALRGLGVHVGDDVLRVDLAGLGVRRTSVADHARGLGRGAIEL